MATDETCESCGAPIGFTGVCTSCAYADPLRLRFLDRLGMHPGTAVQVMDKQPFEGPLTLRINSVDHAIGRELASTVYVRSSEEEEFE